MSVKSGVVRSLEQYISCQDILLMADHTDHSPPSQSEQDNVTNVLKEADDPDYWVSASKDGNRKSHYTGAIHTCFSCAAVMACTEPILCEVCTSLDWLKMQGANRAASSCSPPGSHLFIVRLSKSSHAGSALGATLVAKIDTSAMYREDQQDQYLRSVLAEFRCVVDQELPGMYTWFTDASLHVTIRALMG